MLGAWQKGSGLVVYTATDSLFATYLHCQACTMMSTIPMQLAEYVAAGKASTWKHYALAIPCYTHFTSPIRRYADVMVHRILTATLEGGDAMARTYGVETVETIADHCNDKRLAAKYAQERSAEVSISYERLSHSHDKCNVNFAADFELRAES